MSGIKVRIGSKVRERRSSVNEVVGEVEWKSEAIAPVHRNANSPPSHLRMQVTSPQRFPQFRCLIRDEILDILGTVSTYHS